MNDELLRVPVDDLNTFADRAEHYYKIQNKQGQLVPFEFLEAQRVFDQIVEEEFDRTEKEFGNRQCRIIALKPRQVGWTTYSSIRSLDMQAHDEGCHGVIMAHDLDTTDIVYDIFKRGYENMPEYVVPTQDGEDMNKRQFYRHHLDEKQIQDLGVDLSNKEFDKTHKLKVKPDTKSYSGKRLAFDDTNSRTTIATAGKGDAGGKGVTLRRIVLSEAGNYSSYNDLLSSINPSVPKFADNVMFIIESTANGTTGDGEGFYKAWQKSTKEWERYKQGKTNTFGGFRPVFIPWYMIEEYELQLAGGQYEDISEVDFGSPEEKEKFLEREKDMLENGIYNPLTREHQEITPEKINWYRWIIKKDCEYEYKKAQRYYPTTSEEAFVASSHCFFNAIKLNEVKKKFINDGEPEAEKGDLLWDNKESDLVFKQDVMGDLKIWKHPEPDWDNRYVVGADIGRGYEDGDYSVAYVFDRLEQEFVACWFGKVDQDIFAEILVEIGIYYNEALLVPESNLETVVNIIKPSGHTPYIGEIYFEDNQKNVKWGFWTHGGNRQILIDEYKGWLRDNEEGYYVLPDVDTIDEHLSFVRRQTANGVKYEADENSHDDRVIASALCKKGDNWLDVPPKEYKPNKITEIISGSQSKRQRKYMRNHELGKRAKRR